MCRKTLEMCHTAVVPMFSVCHFLIERNVMRSLVVGAARFSPFLALLLSLFLHFYSPTTSLPPSLSQPQPQLYSHTQIHRSRANIDERDEGGGGGWRLLGNIRDIGSKVRDKRRREEERRRKSSDGGGK